MRLTRNQVLNLRSGQTVHYVWGNGVTLHVITARLVGRRSCVRDSELCFKPYRRFGYSVFDPRRQRGTIIGGYRDPHNRWVDMFATSLGGAIGDRYFTKLAQAQRFMQECNDGLWPREVYRLKRHHEALDELDEILGVCDRGLGIYEATDYNTLDDVPADDTRFALPG